MSVSWPAGAEGSGKSWSVPSKDGEGLSQANDDQNIRFACAARGRYRGLCLLLHFAAAVSYWPGLRYCGFSAWDYCYHEGQHWAWHSYHRAFRHIELSWLPLFRRPDLTNR